MSDEEVCDLCGHNLAWHNLNRPRHDFSGQLNVEEKKTKVVKGGSSDLALRIALVDAGVLSYESIALAEERLSHARESGEPIVFGNPDDRSSVPFDGGSASEDSGSRD